MASAGSGLLDCSAALTVQGKTRRARIAALRRRIDMKNLFFQRSIWQSEIEDVLS
jgi:hypothetical protein